MNLQELLATLVGVLMVCLCWSTGIYMLTTYLLDRKIYLRTWALYSGIFFAIQLPLNFMLLFEILPYNVFIWDIGLFTIQLMILAALLYRVYGERPIKTLSAAALAHFVQYTYQSVWEVSIHQLVPWTEEMSMLKINFLYAGLPHGLMLLLTLLTLAVLRKSRFNKYFSFLFTSRSKSALTCLLCFLLMNSYALLSAIFPQILGSIFYAVCAFAVILLALFILQFVAMFALNREKVCTQEETILQQQAHLRLLEELQAELKAFRHDFQNLLSGVALQARDGDLEGIQTFLQNTTGYFDHKLGEEIRQMSVLSQIQIYPLRSLLTIKLADMREKGIHVHLEILLPVTRCGMKEEDLLRCLGILLDNATEAAAQCSPGHIRILILQETQELRIAVSNSCLQKPAIKGMQTRHYTTKGVGRGTGLASYRRILNGYPGCVNRTLWADDLLTQELRASLR